VVVFSSRGFPAATPERTVLGPVVFPDASVSALAIWAASALQEA